MFIRYGFLSVIMIILSGCSYVRYASEGVTVADQETTDMVLRGILLFEAKGGREQIGVSVGYAKYDKDLPIVANQSLPEIESIELFSEEPRHRIERWVVLHQRQRAVYQIHFVYVVGGGGPDAPFRLKPDKFTVNKFTQ